MAGPVCRREKTGWLSRGLSVALAGAFLYLLCSGGAGSPARSIWGFHYLLIPVIVIWFPEMAANLSVERVSPKTAARLGWLGLGAATVLPSVFWLFR